MEYSEHAKIRMNVEGDRISTLPDDLILKILALIDFKQAIRTSALSTRWRHIWTLIPSLTFSNAEFNTRKKFSKFVTGVLSGRNNQIQVSSARLTFRFQFDQWLDGIDLDKIFKYAFSHNVQQLYIDCNNGRWESLHSVLSSQSLKHLTLRGFDYKEPITTVITWELLALKTLKLQVVKLYNDNTVGLFSNCPNLKNLTLSWCRMESDGFKICHSGLSDLTLDIGYEDGDVVAPQLKTLTIVDSSTGIHLISAPNLASLKYEGSFNNFRISTDFLHLKVVDLFISPYTEDEANARKIVCLLEKLRSVKFLTLPLEITKLLCSSVDLISDRPSPFANLKSLKICPYEDLDYGPPKEQTQPEVIMCNEVKNYLLDASPGATFTMVSLEEAVAVMARKLMRELQVLLDQWKERVKQDKAEMEQEEGANQFGEGHKTTGVAITMLRHIKRLLAKLPASHQAKLQVSFSNLCAEADTVMAVDHLKIQCD